MVAGLDIVAGRGEEYELRMGRGAVLVALWWGLMVAAAPAQVAIDSDHDGLSDELEAKLLQQFQPLWMVSKDDCSVRTARFSEGISKPTVVEDDGTIYGQAFPVQSHADEVE